MRETDGPQNWIIDSYKYLGGQASKWATEWQKGRPDLVASLPDIGLHLVEVKWRREFRWGQIIPNPMERKQVQVARDWMKAGGWVACALVVGPRAIDSFLGYYNPLWITFELDEHKFVPYVRGKKFDVGTLIRRHIDVSTQP